MRLARTTTVPAILFVPGLMIGVKRDPDETQENHAQRKETSQRAHNGRFPIHGPSIHAHDVQIEHDATDRRAAQFAHMTAP